MRPGWRRSTVRRPGACFHRAGAMSDLPISAVLRPCSIVGKEPVYMRGGGSEPIAREFQDVLGVPVV
jgi:hypothetical protein